MASWQQLTEIAPDLATALQGRFGAHIHALLGSLRRDGSPRISGIETTFALGELWLGMMPGSFKAADLRRDPRLALHAAVADEQLTGGDAKISGRAREVIDTAEVEAFIAHLQAEHGDKHADLEAGGLHLFRVDVTEVGFLTVEGDHMVIESWREGSQVRRIERS
ncbi:pyridoxamine 5'-phosphate oxidase family protein [soil metagenome]